ncbi:MAG TPA: SCO family protein [Dongiaceae bacterium]|jgi:protein SCO1/2|nr:SCO family protein [Dongiaceae bacterium]
MLRSIVFCLSFLGLVTAFGAAVGAHSLEEVEAETSQKEKYFQPIDKPAPDFTLRDADGRIVRLIDFRGKVVVLHFIYTHCPDICPLHAERIKAHGLDPANVCGATELNVLQSLISQARKPK